MSEEKIARDILEEKDPTKLNDGEHLALAIYNLADVVGEYLEQEEDDEIIDR